MNYNEHNEMVMQKFADLMIERMEAMKESGWQIGWVGNTYGAGPVNVTGNGYGGANIFFLLMYSGMKGFKYPIFCTVKQANKMGAHINKGEKSVPVIFWDRLIKTSSGKTITQEVYDQLAKAQQADCTVYPILKSYNVFNIEQTNLEEVKPEKMDTLKKLFVIEEQTDTKGMYECPCIDKMLEQQSWLCPISYKKRSDRAFYSPSQDKIVIPTKAQFRRGKTADDVYKDGQEYYSSLLHEMVHSTGSADRLGREGGKRFGDDMYAREELVAELGAARVGQILGFDKRILDNNAAYLDGWVAALKKQPKFILTLLTDVDKAARMITERIAA